MTLHALPFADRFAARGARNRPACDGRIGIAGLTHLTIARFAAALGIHLEHRNTSDVVRP